MFSKLIVKNFRSFSDDGIEIDLTAEKSLFIIVGSNNVGKSNLLEALALVLGVYPFKPQEISEDDFFARDTSKELLIELYLSVPLVDRDVYQTAYEIHGFRLRAWRKLRGDEKGVLDTEHYCFDKNGKTIVKPPRIYKKPKDGADDLDNSQRPVAVKDQAWRLGEFFFLDPISLGRFFDRSTGYSPLGRLFDIYRQDFQGDHNTFTLSNGDVVPRREAYDRFIGKVTEILTTKKLKEIESALSGRLSTYLGKQESPLGIDIGVPTYREIFDKWVSIQTTDREQIPPLPIERLGSGYRALLRLAVIQSILELKVSQNKKYTLLIEEPESYLHTHLRRYFARVLREFANQGHTVVMTTHSPEFVDLTEPWQIIRLTRTDSATRKLQVPAMTKLEKIRQKITAKGNSEVIFAERAILCEGQDDQAAVSIGLAAKGIDADVHSISVLDCGSADSLPDYIRLCGHLGIDFFVLHDFDQADVNASQKTRNGKIAGEVERYGANKKRLHVFQRCLEDVLSIEHHCGVEVVADLLEGKSYTVLETAHPEFTRAIDSIVDCFGLARQPGVAPNDIANEDSPVE